MSAPNPRKRAAPGASPMMPIPQQMQPQYNAGNPAGDQVMRWNGMGDPSSFMNGADGIMDGNAHVGNSFGLVPAQPQYAQPVSTPSNTLARRQMNRALVPTNARPYDGAVEPWGNFVGDDNALLQQNPSENLNEQDNVEILEEMAQKAKREAQAKRKQIPPFVQKLSSFLEERKNEDLIRWSEKGDSFIVLDEDEFAKTLIPELFKHNNYASFVRQLNMYGFHKRVGLSDNSMRASERKNKSPSEYSNPYFRRGHPNLLWLINKPKSGSKAKKGAKGAEIDNDSEDEGATEEILASGLGASAAQAPRSLPAGDSQPIPKKEMTLVREELTKVREQQKLILGAINRLQRNNNDLYQQAVMFQNQHDRHQNSINAILNFLANVFRKTLEDQGNSQNVNDIISSMLTNQNQQSAQHGSVVDLGDFIQQMDPSSYGTPHKKARGLLPPIPNQNRAQSVRSPTPNRSTLGNSTYQTVNHHNPEMGHVTELQENSPSDTNSPNLRQELEANPHEQMLKMINEHNATNNHGLDLPEAAELVANAPNTLSNAQRSKLVNFMAGQSSSAPSARSTPAPTPVSATPAPAAAQIPTSSAHMTMPTMPTSTSVSPPPIESNPPPSLSPIMGPPMAPPSLNEINTNQLDLDQLQRLQSEQDAKISELGSILGPLSPSGHVPGLGDNEAYFDPQSADFDQFFDSNALFGEGQYNTDGTDFNFSLDTDPSHQNLSLHTGHPLHHVSHHNTPKVIERIEMILKAGANVVMTTKGIDDMCLKLFIERGAMAIRRCKKEDLRRIAKATGASFLSTLSDLNGDEKFDPSSLGYAEEVSQERISDDELILVKGCKEHSSASILLRGSNDLQLDEMERSVHDSLCAVKRTLESGSVVPGGGAVETALHIYLEEFAGTVGSREQLAIGEFAQSLLVIPKTLAVNAAKDASELVAQLRSRHALSQRIQDGEANEDEKTVARKKGYKNYGLDLMKGKVVDELKAGVLEPSMSKIRQLKSAVEACISIMRIDTLIKLDPEERGEQDDGHGH